MVCLGQEDQLSAHHIIFLDSALCCLSGSGSSLDFLSTEHSGSACLSADSQEQEGWLLAGWQRSKYDEDAGPNLGVIVNIDRVVVVTGVSSGIGYGIAKSLIAHQCHVFGR